MSWPPEGARSHSHGHLLRYSSLSHRGLGLVIGLGSQQASGELGFRGCECEMNSYLDCLFQVRSRFKLPL